MLSTKVRAGCRPPANKAFHIVIFLAPEVWVLALNPIYLKKTCFIKNLPSGPNKRVFVVGAEPAFRGVLTRLFGQALVEPQSCYSP